MKAKTNMIAVEKKFVPFDVTLTVESEQEGMFLLAMFNAPMRLAGFDTYCSFSTIDDALRSQGIDRNVNQFFNQNREIYKFIGQGGK